jgi:hypothetical protein
MEIRAHMTGSIPNYMSGGTMCQSQKSPSERPELIIGQIKEPDINHGDLAQEH